MFFVFFFILSLNVYAGEKAPCELALMDLGRLKLETLGGKMPRADRLLVESAYQERIKELAKNLNIPVLEAEKIVAEYIEQNSLKLHDDLQSKINKTKETDLFNLDLEKVFKATEGTGVPDTDGILRRPQTNEARTARQAFREALENNSKSINNKYLQVLLSFAEESNQMDLLLDLDPVLFKYTPILKVNETVEFTMGSSKEEQEKYYGNNMTGVIQVRESQHKVKLTKPYGLTQLISVGAWKIVENGQLPPQYYKKEKQEPRDEEPLRYVSWNMGMDHLKKLNERARKLFNYPADYNLFDYPTEAEWEYAARLNETGKPQITAFPWGDEWEEERGWVDDHTKRAYDGGSFPLIGLKKATGKGLSDMYKVLWQWCKDEFKEIHGDYRDPKNVSIDPGHESGSDTNVLRSLRGGNPWNNPRDAAAARRGKGNPEKGWNLNGLRLRQVEK